MALIRLEPRGYNKTSRYGIYNQLLNTNDNKVHLDNVNPIKINCSNPQFHVVESNEENRLDIIANNYYGSPSFWWFIAMANNILDPSVIIVGTILKIPSINDIYKTGGPLVSRG